MKFYAVTGHLFVNESIATASIDLSEFGPTMASTCSDSVECADRIDYWHWGEDSLDSYLASCTSTARCVGIARGNHSSSRYGVCLALSPDSNATDGGGSTTDDCIYLKLPSGRLTDHV